jgi:hypothetical protein
LPSACGVVPIAIAAERGFIPALLMAAAATWPGLVGSRSRFPALNSAMTICGPEGPPSMVLFEVNTIGVSFFKFKCDPPLGAYPDGEPNRLVLLKLVKVEPGDIQLLGIGRPVHNVQYFHAAGVKSLVDPACAAFLEKLLQTLVLVALDHG